MCDSPLSFFTLAMGMVVCRQSLLHHTAVVWLAICSTGKAGHGQPSRAYACVLKAGSVCGCDAVDAVPADAVPLIAAAVCSCSGHYR